MSKMITLEFMFRVAILTILWAADIVPFWITFLLTNVAGFIGYLKATSR